MYKEVDEDGMNRSFGVVVAGGGEEEEKVVEVAASLSEAPRAGGQKFWELELASRLGFASNSLLLITALNRVMI